MNIEKVYVATLGCRVNQYESEAIAQSFSDYGYELTRSKSEADILVINTCAVTRTAESKSRRLIRHLHKENPHALIIVTGCYSQKSGHELIELEGVSLVTGNGEKERLVALVEEVKRKPQPQMEVGDIRLRHHFPCSEQTIKENRRIRAYLKIEDGCEQHCSYCIVPHVRGPVVSRAYDDVIAEAKSLADHGFQELVLTGIHTGFYGRDLPEGDDLLKVLRGLLRETAIPRIRLGSLEPGEVSDELIALLAAEPRLCPHLHIPLQSGDNLILNAMGRRYSRAQYLELVTKIYDALPAAAISADIIVGFPGESEKAFENTLALAKQARFAFIHAFPYSPRPGTRAAILPHRVPLALKEERQKRLLSLGHQLKNDFAARFIGCNLAVLVEKKDKSGLYRGHCPNFLPVHFTSKRPQLIGKIVTVKGESQQDGTIYGGEIIE